MAISVVQVVSGAVSASAAELSFEIATTVGNLLVVGVTWQNSADANAFVSDSSSQSYTALTERQNPGTTNVWAQWFYTVNADASAHTVTANFSVTPGTVQMWCLEIDGANTIGVLENGNEADNVASLDAGTLTPTAAESILVALMRLTGDRVITPPSGWTPASTPLSRSHVAYRLATAVGGGDPSANALIAWTGIAQPIAGFGASSYANQFPDDVIANADLLFSVTSGVGLSLDRMGLAHNPDTGGRPYKCREIAALAHARGAIVWASNFYPPAIWKSNGIPTNGGFLLPEHYQDYATLLADEIEDLETTYGVPLYALSIQNESGSSQTWGSCLFSDAQFQAFLPVLKQTFINRSISTLIMMPEQESWRFDRATGTLANVNLAAMVDILAAHPYSKPDGFANPHYGVKPVWQTEHSIGTDTDHGIITGLIQAEEIHDFMVTAQANSWHAWNLGVIMGGKRLYTLGNWSKWVRPGWVRITSSQAADVLTSAFKNASTGAFAIVVINDTAAARTRTFGLAGATCASVTPWVTSATQNLVQQASLTVTGSVFTATLPASSVTTFVGTGVTTGADTPYPSVFTWPTTSFAVGATAAFRSGETGTDRAPGAESVTLAGTTSPLGFTINMPGEFL